MAGFFHDLRYAARLHRRHAGFTLLVVLTIALGIGATTTLFSVTYGVLMKPLPWPNADSLVLLEETRGGRRPRFSSFTNAAYLSWRERASTVEALAAWAPRTVTLSGDGDPERIRIVAATATLFPALGVRPFIGSLFDEEDETSRRGPVIVLSESLWRERFGADTAVLGRLAHLDDQPYRVIGVISQGAAYPDRETRAWVPFRIQPAASNSLSMFSALAKLQRGATPEQAAAEGTARGRFVPATGMTTMAIFGGNGPVEVSARPLADAMTSSIRTPLVILFAGVGLLLITATANVANLQVARATTRRREIGIRAALGAGDGRVVRQLLIESAVLGLAGGAAGLGLAALLHSYIPVVLPADFPRIEEIGLNAVVVFFAGGMSLLTSIACGVLPALRIGRISVMESLTQDGTRGGAASRGVRARALIMTAQVAIACILLVAGALVVRSFHHLLTADRGYDPAGLLTARLSMPAALYPPERRHTIAQRVLDRLESIPGVIHAAFTSELPLTPGGSTSAFTLPSPQVGGEILSVQASPRIVGPRAFDALRMRVVAGRGFDHADTETSMPVVVVNRTFARRYLGDAPIGSHVPMGVGYQSPGVKATVVGVVDDVRYPTARESSLPEMYYSYRQFGGGLPVTTVTLLVRTEGDPASLGSMLRTAVREADHRLVPEVIMTLEDRLLTGLAHPRLYAVLLGGFAAFAVIIAAVGLFAVLSYSVGLRSRELAVRTALGARKIDLVRLVIAQGLRVTAAGTLIGVTASLVLARGLGSFLHGIAANDPVTYVAVAGVLLLVLACATAGPARRAARVEPGGLLKS